MILWLTSLLQEGRSVDDFLGRAGWPYFVVMVEVIELTTLVAISN